MKSKEHTNMAWDIDPVHSHVAFSVRHMMVSTVRGRFNVLRGHLHIDEANPANSWVEAEVDVKSVDTQNEQRDAHLRTSDFFEADKYPVLTFKSTKVQHVGDQDYKVIGDLTMHGVTRPVTFNAEYNGQSEIAGRRAGLTARTKVNRKDFGMEFGLTAEASQIIVSDTVNIEIDLEAVEQPAAVEAESVA
jgi:polyisoprenoid-binding protein YceI